MEDDIYLLLFSASAPPMIDPGTAHNPLLSQSVFCRLYIYWHILVVVFSHSATSAIDSGQPSTSSPPLVSTPILYIRHICCLFFAIVQRLDWTAIIPSPPQSLRLYYIRHILAVVSSP
ncbi:hypothetical protein AVEN_175139-1 [Araneus ventricosus]|uniref:Uncharacterized protein n=1 Tax=Araneus ventricosus TaxID=182803 RepID=A0A4Y2BLM6_ARAVE|nr:hypothetical protein AVEN_175139-1 [Araneus ventricosus]